MASLAPRSLCSDCGETITQLPLNDAVEAIETYVTGEIRTSIFVHYTGPQQGESACIQPIPVRSSTQRGKLYFISRPFWDQPATCTCPRYAIDRNKAGGKGVGATTWCKHLDYAMEQGWFTIATPTPPPELEKAVDELDAETVESFMSQLNLSPEEDT